MGSMNFVIQQGTYYYTHTASLTLWFILIGPNNLLQQLEKMLEEEREGDGLVMDKHACNCYGNQDRLTEWPCPYSCIEYKDKINVS